MDGYDKDKIVICPNCGKPEYWGQMRVVDGMNYCRGCYIAILEKRNVLHVDTKLGGPVRHLMTLERRAEELGSLTSSEMKSWRETSFISGQVDYLGGELFSSRRSRIPWE